MSENERLQEVWRSTARTVPAQVRLLSWKQLAALAAGQGTNYPQLSRLVVTAVGQLNSPRVHPGILNEIRYLYISTESV